MYKKVYKLDESSKIITVLPLWHNYAMFACLTSAMRANSQIIIMNEWNIVKFIYIYNYYYLKICLTNSLKNL